MKKTKILILIFFVVFLCNGCASIISGNQTKTKIITDVPARAIILDPFGRKVCAGTTPLNVTLRSFIPVKTANSIRAVPNEYTIRIQEIADQKNIQEFRISANINPDIFLNICFLIISAAQLIVLKILIVLI